MNYSNITVKQYKEIMEIIKTTDDITEANYLIICSLFNKDVTLDEFREGLKEIQFLNNAYEPKKVKRKYTVGDRDYEVELDPRHMQANQYIDYQTFIKDPDNHLCNIAACFLIPAGKKYNNGYDVLNEAEYLYEHLTVDVLQDIFFFFQKLYQELTLGTLRSLESTMKKELKKEKDPLIRRKLMRGMIECRLARKQILSQKSGDGFVL